jgi:hypothetical protein
MAFPQGDILRRLHEAARPFGVFFKIHRLSPKPGCAAASNEHRGPRRLHWITGQGMH